MIICIDPGHGGADPGAVGPTGLKEAEVNLFVARALARRLIAHDSERDIIMTRTGPQGLSLTERCHISNRAKAQRFVSIHCNSFTNASAGGFEVYHAPGSKRGQALAQAVLTVVQDEGLVQGGPQPDAKAIKSRGVKVGRFTVLTGTAAPAILIELAFISNPAEENLLHDHVWLTRMADAIALAVGS